MTHGLPTIYAPSPSSSPWYLFREHGAYYFDYSDIPTLSDEVCSLHASRGQVCVPWVEEKFGWLLLDSVGCDDVAPSLARERSRLWRKVIVAPPYPEIYRTWQKQNRAQLCVMKPWPWHEIVAARCAIRVFVE